MMAAWMLPSPGLMTASVQYDLPGIDAGEGPTLCSA